MKKEYKRKVIQMEVKTEMRDKMNEIRQATGCPYYDEDKKCWRVRFPDCPDEEGDLLYIVGEFIKGGLHYRYNTKKTRGKQYSGHA